MSELESDDHEEEYLMSTRQRRSNAGNRMKKLLEQEVEEMQSKTGSLNDDELDLLFKEDAEDEDFESGKSTSEPEETVDREPTSQLEDEDLLLSESDEEESDQDEEDGEKELQRQEKARRKKKKKIRPPVLKKKAVKPASGDVTAEASKKKAPYELLKAESLLVSDRRTSKRSHVVANKLQIYEKLSLAEKKRKIIQERIKKHKERENEVALTQEDRLRIAAETEKLNLQSLDKYKEQEISKKQSRMAMQQRQKLKFKTGETILQEITTSWIVTPAMEVEDRAYWDEQLKKRDKRRKKYPRRQSKKQILASGDKDGKGKSVQKNEPNDRKETVSSDADPKMTEGQTDEGKSLNAVATTERRPEHEVTIAPEGKDAGSLNESVPSYNEGAKKPGDVIIPEPENGSVIEEGPELEHKGVISLQSLHEDGEVDHKNMHLVKAMTAERKEVEAQTQTQNAPEMSSEGNAEASAQADLIDDAQIGAHDNNTTENIKHSNEAKKVTFAEHPQVDATVVQENFTTEEKAQDQSNRSFPETPELTDDTESEPELTYQGPSQEVSKNFVTLYKYGGDYKSDIRDELFGSQWSRNNNQRTAEVVNICKIVTPETLPGSDDKSPIVPDLSFLGSFPAFGEYGKKVIYDVGLNTGKELEVEIKTPAPSGVLFPNGVRKKCFITNKECQYFDPKNGVPYSDVDAYKVIQELQNPLGSGNEDEPDPHFQWFGFKNGGIYLDLQQRPAKGVPEGFT